jgi:hypothetical protein
MEVGARRRPHRRGLDRGIGLPPGASARSIGPAVGERVGNDLHTEWSGFMKSGE